MKFQYKALVAALALSTASLSAQAAFDLNASGDSSFFLTVVDNTNNVSALFDLGFNNSQFSAMVSQATANGGVLSWDLTKGDYASAWSSFWSIAQDNAALQWGVMSADNTGGAAGSRNVITTYASGTKFVSTTQMQSSLTNFDDYLKANQSLGNHADVANGASTATAGAAFAESKAYGTSGRINGTGYDTTKRLGEVADIRQVFTGANAPAPVTEFTLGNANGRYTFSLSSAGVLTFAAPVPEADSYAMLLAGLGVIGLVARRRKA
ncbi:PEP-CTERM sorting domain-containing protein [Methylophilus glucosoxydans]|uniref:PEP-CTERM sorting domain-containing protein n=1 Tax=Methylophilus glucosoxydans TaxID=752553 RepID=A0ABW3GPY5_9PROT|nr:PEP-CTERM sorting domain-containing protein [Methylophilus sp. 13]MBF5038674.1 PEP-CTERM sorting domain-containing protein [Methylophilus sp. 13]